jgi:hypothetical protein
MPAMRLSQKALIQELRVRREALVILIYSKNYSQLIVNHHPCVRRRDRRHCARREDDEGGNCIAAMIRAMPEFEMTAP